MNALRTELSSGSPPCIYSQTPGHPAGAGLVWVLPQLEGSASSKPSPCFQMGSPSHLLSLPSLFRLPILTPGTPLCLLCLQTALIVLSALVQGSQLRPFRLMGKAPGLLWFPSYLPPPLLSSPGPGAKCLPGSSKPPCGPAVPLMSTEMQIRQDLHKEQRPGAECPALALLP